MSDGGAQRGSRDGAAADGVRRHSLRGRLTAGLLLGVTTVLGASGLGLHWLMEQRLTAAFDDSLRATLWGQVAAIREELRGSTGPRLAARPPLPPSARAELSVQVRAADGRSLLRSEHLSADLPRLARGLAPAPPGAPDRAALRFAEVAHPDQPGAWRAVAMVLGAEGPPRPGPLLSAEPGRSGRPGPEGPPGRRPGAPGAARRERPGAGESATTEEQTPPGGAPDPGHDPVGGAGAGLGPRDRLPPGPGPAPGERRGPQASPLEIVLLGDARPLQATLDTLAGLLLLTWLVGSAVAAGVVAVLLRQGLAPLGRLQRQIEAVRGPDDGARFTLPDAPAELAPVVARLNGLLDRMAAALRREQEFSAHAAHELRTPLAGLKATLDLALSRPREVEAYRDAARRSLAIVDELAGMVETLLLLAREHGGRPRACQLADVLDPLRHAREPLAAARGLSWRVDVADAPAVYVDERLLVHLLTNLLDNALEHGDAGGLVQVEAAALGERVVLRVRNPCRAAPADLPDRALEPFWRGDAARTDAARHAGLGLALCRRIAGHVGGALSVALDRGTVTVTLTLPRAAGVDAGPRSRATAIE